MWLNFFLYCFFLNCSSEWDFSKNFRKLSHFRVRLRLLIINAIWILYFTKKSYIFMKKYYLKDSTNKSWRYAELPQLCILPQLLWNMHVRYNCSCVQLLVHASSYKKILILRRLVWVYQKWPYHCKLQSFSILNKGYWTHTRNTRLILKTATLEQ